MSKHGLFARAMITAFFLSVIVGTALSQENLKAVGRYQYAQFDGVWYTVIDGRQGDLVDTKHLIVRLKDKSDIRTFDFGMVGIPKLRDVRGRFADGFYQIEIPLNLDPFEVARRLQNTGRFDEVHLNVFVRVNATPNDQHYTNQWNLPRILMPAGWDITTGSSSVIVAVVDVGGDYNHEDLQANRWDGIGYDFYSNDSDPYPSDGAGHGTAVAGILGAATNNMIGVAGVAGGWSSNGGVRIMHLDAGWRNANGDELIDVAASAQAIDSASAWGARVINMSFGSLDSYSAWESAINRAVNNYGVVCVASAGNYRSGQSTAVRYPAAYTNVIAVGATIQNDNRKELNDGSGENWWGSCYGSQLDVMAPGIFIWTTDITGSNGYSTGNYHDRFNGTSASAPHVAGLAALIRSVNPSLTWQQVRDILRGTADKVPGMGGQNFTNEYGYGRINADRAVKEALPKLINYTFTSNTTLGYTRLLETATLGSNVVVTVESGRTVVMEGLLRGGTNSEFRVYGTLILETAAYVTDVNIRVENGGRLVTRGTASGRITFTSTSGTWQGITFSSAGPSNLSYCDISYASMPIKATNTSNLTISNVTIGNSTFYNGSDNAAMAFYNSSPTISNVTINGQSNSWNGVRFAQGSTGSVSGSTIQNLGAGNGIVVEGNSSPTISLNTIRNNYYHGIVVVNNGTGNPIITGNTIESNGIVNGNKTYNGINFYYSSGKVVENTVRYSNFGVSCDSYSSPSSSHGGQGKNLLTANRFGILVHYNSNPSFGTFNSSTSQYFGACNKILTNEVVNAKAQYSSTLWVQGAWWGADPPDASKIVAVENSLIEYSYWRPFDDNDCIYGPQPRVAETGTSGTDDVPTMLRQALIARQQGNYAQAVALYRTVLTSSLKTAEQQRALIGLFEVYRDSKDPSVLADIARYQSVAGTLGLVASELLMQMYASMGRFEEAKKIALGLALKYRNSETEQRALITLASFGGFSENQRSVSLQYLTELVQRYSATVDKGLLVALGATVGEGSAKIASGESGQRELSISNYPNPFNPSTVIRFTLPEAGHVSLKVFDLLGREVASLLNEHRNAGSHQILFDASALPSGMYFYRLESAGRVMIQKMVLAR